MFSRTSSTQQKAIKEFRDITNTSEKVATEYLKNTKYNVQEAIDAYYNDGGNKGVSTISNEMKTTFEKYKEIGLREESGGDESLDAIQGDGLLELLNDLAIDPTSISAFVFCWKMNMKVAFTLTRDEWNSGLNDYHCTTFSQLKQKMPQWTAELKNETSFRQFYTFVFDYSKEEGSRSLPVDVAVPTWKVVLLGRYKYLDQWCEFIEKEFNKAIPKDLWTQFLEFTKLYTDLSRYEDDGAWPSAIDSFVDYMKEKGLVKK